MFPLFIFFEEEVLREMGGKLLRTLRSLMSLKDEK
jgi:hypothetical protein